MECSKSQVHTTGAGHVGDRTAETLSCVGPLLLLLTLLRQLSRTRRFSLGCHPDEVSGSLTVTALHADLIPNIPLPAQSLTMQSQGTLPRPLAAPDPEDL